MGIATWRESHYRKAGYDAGIEIMGEMRKAGLPQWKIDSLADRSRKMLASQVLHSSEKILAEGIMDAYEGRSDRLQMHRAEWETEEAVEDGRALAYDQYDHIYHKASIVDEKASGPTVKIERFYKGDTVKIKLHPGWSITIEHGGPSDEGWNRVSDSYYYDAESGRVVHDRSSEGRDCDGSHGRYDTYTAAINDDGSLGDWHEEDSEIYDQFAISAGY